MPLWSGRPRRCSQPSRHLEIAVDAKSGRRRPRAVASRQYEKPGLGNAGNAGLMLLLLRLSALAIAASWPGPSWLTRTGLVKHATAPKSSGGLGMVAFDGKAD